MYLDPGFGSMLIQALIGLIAVAGSSFYLFRQRIKVFFQDRKNKRTNVLSQVNHGQNPEAAR
jgi:hypothetical protein